MCGNLPLATVKNTDIFIVRDAKPLKYLNTHIASEVITKIPIK